MTLADNLFELNVSLPGHDYYIMVPREQPVTYLTGPNGYGKTSVLKLVKNLQDGVVPDIITPFTDVEYADDRIQIRLKAYEDAKDFPEDLPKGRAVLLPFQDMTGFDIDVALAKAMAPVVLDPNSVPGVEGKAKKLTKLMDKYMEGAHTMELLPGGYVMFRSPTGGMTTHKELSVGERKLLLLLWTIVFNDDTDVLYLVDSPDEGMHIEWHMELNGDLPALMEEKRSHAFVATHSPHLINACWRTSIDLYELEHPKQRRDEDD